MSTRVETQANRAAAWLDVTGLLSEVLARVGRLYRSYHNRTSAAVLDGASDYILADIGLTRADLRDALAEPVWRDPTSLMRARACAHRHGQ